MKIDSNNTSRRKLIIVTVLLAGCFLFGASGFSKEVSGSSEFSETESVDGIHTKTGPSILPATDGTTPFGITLDRVWLPDTVLTFNP